MDLYGGYEGKGYYGNSQKGGGKGFGGKGFGKANAGYYVVVPKEAAKGKVTKGNVGVVGRSHTNQINVKCEFVKCFRDGDKGRWDGDCSQRVAHRVC